MELDTRISWNKFAYIREFIHRKPRMCGCWQFFWVSISLAQAMVLFGISDAFWSLWWYFGSYISVSFSDFGWRCLDDLMLKVFRMHKQRGSFGHMERMHWMHSFRGSISLAEYNALLALWWFCNMISLLRSFWFWSWKVIFVIWWKGHVETYDVKIVIFIHVRTCSNV